MELSVASKTSINCEYQPLFLFVVTFIGHHTLGLAQQFFIVILKLIL